MYTPPLHIHASPDIKLYSATLKHTIDLDIDNLIKCIENNLLANFEYTTPGHRSIYITPDNREDGTYFVSIHLPFYIRDQDYAVCPPSQTIELLQEFLAFTP